VWYTIFTIECHVENLEEVPLGCCRVPGFGYTTAEAFVVVEDTGRILNKQLLQLDHGGCPVIISLVLNHNSATQKKPKTSFSITLIAHFPS